MNEYRDRRADQFDRGYDIREAGQAATNDYRNQRLGQIGRGLDIREQTAADNKAYRNKRLEQLDRKGGGSQGLPAPRKKNDKIRNPSTGEIISSSDGKNWDYKSTDGKTWTKR